MEENEINGDFSISSFVSQCLISARLGDLPKVTWLRHGGGGARTRVLSCTYDRVITGVEHPPRRYQPTPLAGGV